jgi:hypothetical protein
MTDYTAMAEKWLRETPEGGRALDALGRRLAAQEAERQANSDQSRAAAQAEAMAARRDLDAATGDMDLRRRRMLAHARALPNGARTDAAEFERFAAELTLSPGGRVMARLAIARYLEDSAGDLGERLAGVGAMEFMQTSDGRDGLLTGTITSAGVDRQSGPALPLRLKTIADAGYTLGAEYGGGRAPHVLWKRAARAYNEGAARFRMGGYDVKNVADKTVRDWVARNVNLPPGSPKAGDLFNEAKRDGAAARLPPDPSRMLPA